MKWLRTVVLLFTVVSLIGLGRGQAWAAPAVNILSPKAGEVILGSEVTVTVEVTGTTLTRPDGTKDPTKTHLQLFLDVAPPAGTDPVPVQAPYVHIFTTSHTFKDVKPGEHTLIVQLAYGDHSPVQPSVQATVKFTTREAKKIGLFGVVLTVSASAINLGTKQGALDIKVGPETEIRVPGQKDASLTNVAAGKRLTILANTADGVYSALRIMVIPGEPQNNHIVGTITAISATTITIVDAKGKSHTIDIGAETKLLLPRGVTEPKVGDFVTVVGNVDKATGTLKARPVTIHPHTVQAAQNAVNHIKNLQAILNKAPEQARPALEEALQKVKAALEEMVKASGGNVDKVKKDWAKIEGEGRVVISAIDATAKTVTLTLASGEKLTLKIVAATKIEKDDKDATLASLAVGDRVEKLAYDSVSLEVRKLEVESARLAKPAKIAGRGRVTISAIDAAARTVTLTLASGEKRTLKIVAATKIEKDDKDATLASLAVGDRVEELLYDSASLEARRLEVESAQFRPVKIDGEDRAVISAIDATAKTVTFTLASGEKLTLKIVAATKIEKDDKDATLASLAVGDRVEKLSYDSASLEARRLEMESAQLATAKAKDLGEVKSKLEEISIRHQEVLQRVLEQVPEPAQAAIQRAIEQSQTSHESALKAVGGNVARVKSLWAQHEKAKAEERAKAKPAETRKAEPTPQTAPGKEPPGRTEAPSHQKININTAVAQLLENLPGIGPVRAAAIVEYRRTYGPFRHIEDLDKVPGIGPVTLEKIKDLIAIGN